MKLQGSGIFHPKTLQSQNCQRAENRLSLNGLEFVHGQLKSILVSRAGDDVPSEEAARSTSMASFSTSLRLVGQTELHLPG
jgi:hypothetical protein